MADFSIIELASPGTGLEAWAGPTISALSGIGGAVIGAVVGGRFARRAAQDQVERNQHEADKAAIFAINAKLIQIADEAERTQKGIDYAIEQDSVWSVAWISKPKTVAFSIDELYRAFRMAGANSVEGLRRVDNDMQAMASIIQHVTDQANRDGGFDKMMTAPTGKFGAISESLCQYLRLPTMYIRTITDRSDQIMEELRQLYLAEFDGELPTRSKSNEVYLSPNAQE